MKLLRILVLLCCVLVVGACTRTGSVTGTVASQTTGKPIQGALVEIGELQSTTTSQGAFAIEKVPYGSATVLVEATGYPALRQGFELKSESTTQCLVLADAKIAGHVEEIAVDPQPITNGPEVAIAANGDELQKVEVDANGDFSVAGLHVGKVKVTVTPATGDSSIPDQMNHETYTGDVELRTGDNTMTAGIPLTAVATYRRYADAYTYQHYDRAYLYVHPDVKKKSPYNTLANFAKSFQKSYQVTYVSIGQVRMLPKWTSKLTKATYQNVAEIDRSVALGLATDNSSQHWVKMKNGIWYVVSDE